MNSASAGKRWRDGSGAAAGVFLPAGGKRGGLSPRRLVYEPLEPRQMLAVLLQYEFAETAAGAPVTDNMPLPGIPFTTAGLADESGNGLQGQFNTFNNLPGPTVNYVTDSIPGAPSPVPPGWDGRAVRFQGDTFIRHFGGQLKLDSSFSAVARIMREGAAGTGLETIMGSGHGSNNGWDVFIHPATRRLEVSLRGGLNDVFAGNGPIIANNVWTDVGITFEGTTGDAIPDTLKVYIDGSLQGTFTGNATYDSEPSGINFAFGGDTFGNQRFKGLYERLIVWDEVLDDAEMAAMSSDTVQPEPVPLGPAPTDDGQWWQFRGDRQLTGRAELVGDFSSPDTLWSTFVGSRRVWTALTADAQQSGTQDLRQGNLTLPSDGKIAWGLGGPYFDLNGTGFLSEVGPSYWYKIGNFLPAVAGLEKVELELLPNGDGRARMFRHDQGTWQQQWQSAIIPQLQLVPSVIGGDFDDDGQMEVAFTAWHNTYVLSAATGVVEGIASFNPVTAESGRPYGWHGSADFNGDGKQELVVMGDFENKIGVVGYNSSGQLVTLWRKLIERGIEKKKTVHHPGVDPLQDITGDGRPEIVTSIYNEANDGRWHIVAFDGMTGAVILDLPDQYLTGLRDIDGDGNSELLTTVSLNGPAPSTSGTIKIIDYDGGVLSTIWAQNGVGYQTGNVQDFPLNANSGTGTGRLTLLAGVTSEQETRPTFFTRQAVGTESGEVRITAWKVDDAGQVVAGGTAEGPHLNIIAIQAATSGEAGILLQSEVPGDTLDQLTTAGFAAQAVYSRRVGPGQTSAVVGRLNPGESPTIIVGGASEQLVAFQVDPYTYEVSPSWTNSGRGEFTGGANFTGQYGTGNVVLAELRGDGSLATIAATRTAQGLGRLVAIDADGTEFWHADFNISGAPPVWNVGGITTWKAGRFRFADRDDVLVSVRQSSMHSDVYYLLDGQTGDVVWTRDWGNTPGSVSHDRGAGGSQLAILDYDGDGLDEAINIYPDAYYIIDGDGSNLRNVGLANGAVYPGIWPQGGIPIVDTFLGDGSHTVLHTGSLNVAGLLDADGRRIWHAPGSYSQFSPAVGDFDGDGSFELFLDEAAYDAQTGEQLWTVSISGTPGPGVSADIDGDGRDEAIVTANNTLYVIGVNDEGTGGEIEFVRSFSGTLGMPVIADADGDGRLEIIVVSDNGTVRAFGQQPAVLAGDFDEDGDVDGHDFLFWQMGLGVSSGAEHNDGDGDRDGDVDGDDNLIWQAQFGAVHDSAGGIAALATESAQSSSAPILALPLTTLDRGDTTTSFFFDRLFGDRLFGDIGAADRADVLIWQSHFDIVLGGRGSRDAAIATDLGHRNSAAVPPIPASPVDRGDATTSSLFDQKIGGIGVADGDPFSPRLRDRVAAAFAQRMRR